MQDTHTAADPAAQAIAHIGAATTCAAVAAVIFGDGSEALHALPEHPRRQVMKAALVKYLELPFYNKAGPPEIRFAVCSFVYANPLRAQERLDNFTRLHPTWDTPLFRQAVADALALSASNN
jgi:hypothetical protein